MATKCEHIELSTDDPQSASAFYSKLFGWKVEAMQDPTSEHPYLMFRTENGGGGITAKQMPEQPTAWLPYITVPSVQKALDTATELGGGVIVPHTPIGEMGAIGVLRDPTGGAIGVWETAAKPQAPAKKAAKPAAKKPAAKKPAAKKPAPKKPAAKAKGKAKRR